MTRPAMSWDDYDAIKAAPDAPKRLSAATPYRNTPAAEDPGKRLLGASYEAQMKLEPIKYEWAWEYFKSAQANFWLPATVNTTEDVAQWRNGAITDDEKRVVKAVLGYFATVENAVANNLVQVLHRAITNPEVRMYLAAQTNMECIHQWAYTYSIEIFDVDKTEAYDAMNRVAEVRDKIHWATAKTAALEGGALDLDTLDGKRKLVSNLTAFMLCEGVSFYGGFALILNLRRRNLLPGTCTQLAYIMRDENQHCQFAAALIAELLREHPETADGFAENAQAYALEAVALEESFVDYVLAQGGVLGVSASEVKDHMRYLGKLRLRQLGVDAPPDLESAQPTLGWLSEMMELRKEKNFFETEVLEYTKQGVDWGR